VNKEESLALYKKGRDAWNEWAETMRSERGALKQAGEWSESEISSEWNDATQDWHAGALTLFEKHHFAEDTSFKGFVFPSDAWFLEATFEGHAGFDDATFKGYAGFTLSVLMVSRCSTMHVL